MMNLCQPILGTEKIMTPKPVTKRRLENAALYYLARFEASEAKLRQVLLRRILKAKKNGIAVPPEADVWIREIVEFAKKQNFVSDERFAENLTDKYKRAGKSRRFIQTKLKLAGIDAETIASVCDENDEDELTAACALVKKKKLGCFRPENQRRAYAKKDLSALARAGFSFDIAVKALNLSETDEVFDEFSF